MPWGQSLSNLTYPPTTYPAPGSGGFGPVAGSIVGAALETGLEWLWDWATRPEEAPRQPAPRQIPPTTLPMLPAPGANGVLGPPSPNGVTTGFARASGLYHVTPCGNYASNSVIFESDPKGGLHAGMVKRISMAKLRRSIMAQVRSRPRHHHAHSHGRKR